MGLPTPHEAALSPQRNANRLANMNVSGLGLDGPLVVEPVVHGDDRGHFFEAFNLGLFSQRVGSGIRFVQDNQSRSSKSVLRGLHYQLDPMAQGKLVRVVSGVVFDVAVDIRRSSPDFGRWVGLELSDANRKQLWIPRGFAHGFAVLSESADLLYKADNYYSPGRERSIRWNDPDLGIDWPLEDAPLLSAKDETAPALAEAEVFA